MRASLLTIVALFCGCFAGCVAPNQKDYLKGEVRAIAFRDKNPEWPTNVVYTHLTIGTDRRPIPEDCRYELLLNGERIKLSTITPEDVRRVGGSSLVDYRPYMKKPLMAYQFSDLTGAVYQFIFRGDQVIQMRFSVFRDLSAERHLRVGRAGSGSSFPLPLSETDVQELLGPAEKIEWRSNW
jgi:hypothetical protein